MVGWSWVVLVGEMIVRAGVVGSIAAFVSGAIMVALVGLTYAELTAAISRAGGEISFAFLGMGSWAAYVCGWTLALAYVSVCAFEAVALPTVVAYLVPDGATGYLYTLAGGEVHASWVAVGVVGSLVVGVVNYRGVRFASFFQGAAAIALLAVGVGLFVPGVGLGEPALAEPWSTGWEGFLRVVVMTPFLFVGFDVIPQVAEDIDVPLRAVGRLIMFSIALALVWYVLVLWSVGVTLPSSAVGALELPTAEAMSVIYGTPWGGRILLFGGLLGIATSWNAFFLGGTRVLFAMSRAGLLPSVFSRVHPRFGSPVAAVALLTAVTALAPLLGRPALVWFVDAGGFAAVVAYFMVAVSFLIIRRRYPRLARPYRVPMARLVGGLAIVVTLFFLGLYLPGSPSALSWPHEWAVIGAWTALGALFALGIPARLAQLGPDGQARMFLGPLAGHVALASTETPGTVGSNPS